MPLTIPDLVSTPELGLRLLADRPSGDSPITWVHVSELADPTPFLTGGELLLTTGITVDARAALPTGPPERPMPTSGGCAGPAWWASASASG